MRKFTPAESELVETLAKAGRSALEILDAYLKAGFPTRAVTSISNSRAFERGKRAFVAAEARRQADEAARARAAVARETASRHMRHREFPGVSLPVVAMLAAHPNYARTGAAL